MPQPPSYSRGHLGGHVSLPITPGASRVPLFVANRELPAPYYSLHYFPVADNVDNVDNWRGVALERDSVRIREKLKLVTGINSLAFCALGPGTRNQMACSP